MDMLGKKEDFVFYLWGNLNHHGSDRPSSFVNEFRTLGQLVMGCGQK